MVNMITNSTLSDIGQLDSLNGGAISIENSDVTLMRNTFVNNKALHGGAILFK